MVYSALTHNNITPDKHRRLTLSYTANALLLNMYHKNPKISDTWKFAVITLKVEQDGFSLE